jgi:hypothetical protein
MLTKQELEIFWARLIKYISTIYQLIVWYLVFMKGK